MILILARWNLVWTSWTLSQNPLLGYNTLPLLRCHLVRGMLYLLWLSQVGWRRLGGLALMWKCAKSIKLGLAFLWPDTMVVPQSYTFMAYSIKLARLGSLPKWHLGNQSHTSGEMKFLAPFTSLRWNIIWHKHKAHREVALLWSVSHKVVALNKWHGRISMEVDKSCPRCSLEAMELVEHMFFSCPLAQEVCRYAGQHHLATLCKKSWAALGSLTQWCNASLINHSTNL